MPTGDELLQALRDRGRTRQELEILLRCDQLSPRLQAARQAGHVAHGPRNRWTLTRAGRLYLAQLEEATERPASRAFEHMLRGNRGLVPA